MRYNHCVRLVVTILWCLAALLWLPWALLAVRLIIDLALGTPWNESGFVQPVLMGLWPRYGWLDWRIASWFPIAALLGMGLSYAGWRLYWWNEDGISTRPPLTVALSIIFPVAAPFVMWRDAVNRHRGREAALASAVDDARQREGEGGNVPASPSA